MSKIVNTATIFRTVCIAAALILSVIGLSGCGFGRSIDLNDYLLYSFTGYDGGYGYVNTEFDYRSFESDLRELYSSEDASKVEGMISIVESEIAGTWDRNEGLSNGDVVTYTWDIDAEWIKENFRLSVKYDDTTAEVSGLEELGEFDPFSDLQVEVSGQAGEGTLQISNPVYPALYYEASKTSGLEPGDEIIISIPDTEINSYVWNYGALPVRTEMTYTVGPMDTVITKVSQIPEDLDAKIRAQLDDFLVSAYARIENKTLVSYEVLGYYVLSPKNGNKRNQLYLVYKATAHTVKDDKEEDVEAYKYLRFTDAMLYKDGTGYVDLLDYTYPQMGFVFDEGFTTSISEYAGYKSLDVLYNQCIASQLEGWVVDSNVVDN